MVLFKEVECAVRWDAGVRAVGFDYGIEIDCNLSVLDQMLVVRIATVLTYHSFTSQILLQGLNLILIKPFEYFKPGLSHQNCETVSLSLVEFYIVGVG